MESLKQLMQLAKQQQQLQQDGETDNKPADSAPPVEYCPFCNKPLSRQTIQIGGNIIYAPFSDPCDCEQGRAFYEKQKAEQDAEQERIKQAEDERSHGECVSRLIAHSGLGARFLSKTLDNFVVDDNTRAAYNTVKEYIANFRTAYMPTATSPPPTAKNGLFIVGDCGTGKTHLAAAIANALMQEEIPVIFGTMITLLSNIKAEFKYSDGDRLTANSYKNVPLLIIDDVGKEQPTEWGIMTLYSIINERYEACLPTIITTNYKGREFITRLTPRETKDGTTASATLDRLREMCRGIGLFGESKRRKNGTGGI